MTQKEQFVELLAQMSVGFTDKPCEQAFVEGLRQKIYANKVLAAQATSIEKALEHSGWSLVKIDEGCGYAGFCCEFLFDPEGKLVLYGCYE